MTENAVNNAVNNAGIHRIVGPTILLGSGTYFDFESPETSELTIEDVAYGLAFACRFAGQCVSRVTGQRVFYSVAEHCVRMTWIVPEELAYDALMHELGEATCGDTTGPLKSICPEYKAVEKRCEAAAYRRFGVQMSDPAAIKRADLVMLATEKRDLMPCRDEVWPLCEGVQPSKYPIVPWSPDAAAGAFLRQYKELRP